MIDASKIKAVVLLSTLKHENEVSNTEVAAELLMEKFEKHGIETRLVRLVEFNIPPGIKSDMGEGDDWPKILKLVLESDIIIFATPIWWGIQSSLMQRVIERMDELNENLRKTGESELANKIGGIIITGAEDGAQHIIGNLCNFMSWNGLTIPPACSLSFLGVADSETKQQTREKMLDMDKTLDDNAKVMAYNLNFFARLLKANPLPAVN